MKVFIRWWSILVVLLCIELPVLNQFIGPCKDPLEPKSTISGVKLSIESERANYSQEEDLVISLKIFNGDSQYIVIYPGLFPKGVVLKNMPQSEIALLIKTQNGDLVSYSGTPVYPQYARVSFDSFIGLRKNYFYGVTVSLKEGDFKYSINKKGKYKIQAIYTTNAKEWMVGELKKRKQTETDLPFPLVRVFNGTLVSNEIEIEVN